MSVAFENDLQYSTKYFLPELGGFIHKNYILHISISYQIDFSDFEKIKEILKVKLFLSFYL